MADRRTVIRASHIVAYQDGGHRYLCDGAIVVEGNRIVDVVATFNGRADETIDATGKIVTPGLISCHSHFVDSPMDKSLLEDTWWRNFYGSMLYETFPTRTAATDEAAAEACIDYSFAEHLQAGATTVAELGGFTDHMVEEAGKIGIRLYTGPMFKSASWYTDDGKTLKYRWDEAAGEESLRRAIAFIEKHQGAYGDRVRGILSPAQVDTCTPALLKKARDAAEEMNAPITLHASQSVIEFNEMVRRHGMSPIEWLREIGFLGPRTILGHAIIVGGSSWTNYPADDVQIMADSGTTVAHSVWVFCRRGQIMESFGRYRKAGINMCLGTDTAPQSMIEAMKFTAICGKIADRHATATTAADAFDAATLGGARALGRDDLGRIAPGAKADLVIWDGGSISLAPVRDPIRNIVYNAQTSDVETVMIDGQVVLRDREILAVDVREITRRLQAGAERMWAGMKDVDRIGRGVDDLSPELYPPFRP